MEGNKAFEQSWQDYCLSNKLATFNDGMARRVIILTIRVCMVGNKAITEGFEAQIGHSAGINTPSDW